MSLTTVDYAVLTSMPMLVSCCAACRLRLPQQRQQRPGDAHAVRCGVHHRRPGLPHDAPQPQQRRL